MSRRALLLTALLLLGGCTSGADQGGGAGLDRGEGGTAPRQPAATTTTTEPPLQLLGKVVDGDGIPVPEATVAVGDSVATTAPDGWFDLQTPGPSMVTITKPGWNGTEVAWDGSEGFVVATIEPLRVRGLRVVADAAGDDARFAALLELADTTAINALVFDTKQEGGRVLYDTSVAEAHEAGAVVRAYDPVQRIEQARQLGLYVITRVVVFEDAFRAQAHPEEAFDGRWINPMIRSSWEYPLALAEEACALGFDEVQFDYVRFPSGSAVETSGQLDLTEAERLAAIEGFLREARVRLHEMGCAVAAAVFAIVVASADDQGIGQRPEELSRQLDVFNPMIYPSHYSNGWLGFDDPNDHPYDVTADAIEDGLARNAPGTILRPWLQAFWWTDEEIRQSIQAAEDRDVGWILWNAVSNFSRASIPTDADVGD